MTSKKNRKIAFLDRDGVIIKELIVDGTPRSARKISDIVILEGVLEAVSLLKSLEFVPVIVTNQPDVSRGFVCEALIASINEFVCKKVEIEHIYTCFHDDSDNCLCRKPKNGLLVAASRELSLSLKDSILIGDRWSDIEAGYSVGSRCYFVTSGKSTMKPKQPHTRVSSLLEASLKEKGTL